MCNIYVIYSLRVRILTVNLTVLPNCLNTGRKKVVNNNNKKSVRNADLPSLRSVKQAWNVRL